MPTKNKGGNAKKPAQPGKPAQQQSNSSKKREEEMKRAKEAKKGQQKAKSIKGTYAIEEMERKGNTVILTVTADITYENLTAAQMEQLMAKRSGDGGDLNDLFK